MQAEFSMSTSLYVLSPCCRLELIDNGEQALINIDLEYTKLRNEDSNPSWPDGVTVYLMKNNTVLKKQYFAPRRDAEMTEAAWQSPSVTISRRIRAAPTTPFSLMISASREATAGPTACATGTARSLRSSP